MRRRPRWRTWSTALEAGTVRAAEPDPSAPGGWRVNPWVKHGILLGFRIPGMRDYRDGPIMAARDRVAYGVLDVLESAGARAAQEAGSPVARRPRRHHGPVRRPPGARHHDHAARLSQHRGVGGSRHHGRLARARRLVRPDRCPGPPVGGGPGRRRAGARGSSTRDRGGRRVRGRRLRPVRGRGRRCGRGPGCGRDPHRPGPRHGPGRRARAARHPRCAAGHPAGFGGGARHPTGAGRVGVHRTASASHVPVIVKRRDASTDARVALEDALR